MDHPDDSSRHVKDYGLESQNPTSLHNMSYSLSSISDMPSVDEQSTHEERKPVAKPETKNRYKDLQKNMTPEKIKRRQAQNRKAQRSFRERKNRQIDELEKLLCEAREDRDALSQENASLSTEYSRLVNEHSQLKSGYSQLESEHSQLLYAYTNQQRAGVDSTRLTAFESAFLDLVMFGTDPAQDCDVLNNLTK
ncbi:hypothetical protein NKR23_g10907 [Pleurostoma richardsiae]|uniref:BZIP domain-containing protein n=1 Tax=Pleurostoma richardsiae TaxID=41990 RepID=A0AA38R223_9PEZI|nr:hypothetical protein NKR23_g10907 [Pleurostoma richardsiae]